MVTTMIVPAENNTAIKDLQRTNQFSVLGLLKGFNKFSILFIITGTNRPSSQE
jgi:hypothetical protein